MSRVRQADAASKKLASKVGTIVAVSHCSAGTGPAVADAVRLKRSRLALAAGFRPDANVATNRTPARCGTQEGNAARGAHASGPFADLGATVEQNHLLGGASGRINRKCDSDAKRAVEFANSI
jgi:hypothetical protein